MSKNNWKKEKKHYYQFINRFVVLLSFFVPKSSFSKSWCQLYHPIPFNAIHCQPFVSNPIQSYPIISYFILSYPILSYPIPFYPIPFYPILPILFYPSYPILSFLSYPSFPILFYSILFYSILFYPILPILSYSILSFLSYPIPFYPIPSYISPFLLRCVSSLLIFFGRFIYSPFFMFNCILLPSQFFYKTAKHSPWRIRKKVYSHQNLF